MLVPSGRQKREKMNQEALASGRDLVASPCRPQGKLRKVVPETIGSLVRESDEFFSSICQHRSSIETATCRRWTGLLGVYTGNRAVVPICASRD
jgi:hypothetical protein